MTFVRILSPLRLIFIIFLAAAVSFGIAKRTASPDGEARVMTYVFDPVISTTSTVLHVTLKFQGGSGNRNYGNR